MAASVQISETRLSEMMDGKKWKGQKSLAVLRWVLLFANSVAYCCGKKHYPGEVNNSVKMLIWYGFTLPQIYRMYKKGVKVADLEHLSLPQSIIAQILGTDSNLKYIKDIEKWSLEYQLPKLWKTVGNVIYLFPGKSKKAGAPI